MASRISKYEYVNSRYYAFGIKNARAGVKRCGVADSAVSPGRSLIDNDLIGIDTDDYCTYNEVGIGKNQWRIHSDDGINDMKE